MSYRVTRMEDTIFRYKKELTGQVIEMSNLSRKDKRKPCEKLRKDIVSRRETSECKVLEAEMNFELSRNLQQPKVTQTQKVKRGGVRRVIKQKIYCVINLNNLTFD